MVGISFTLDLNAFIHSLSLPRTWVYTKKAVFLQMQNKTYTIYGKQYTAYTSTIRIKLYELGHVSLFCPRGIVQSDRCKDDLPGPCPVQDGA